MWSESLASISRTWGGSGSRRAHFSVNPMAFPKLVRTIRAPCSCAIRATLNAMLCGVSTPVTTSRLFSSSTSGGVYPVGLKRQSGHAERADAMQSSPSQGPLGTPPPPLSTLPPPSMPLAEAWSAGAKKGSGGPSLARLPQGKRLVAVVAGVLALVLVVVGAFHFIGHGKGKAPSQKIALALTLTKGQSLNYSFNMSV